MIEDYSLPKVESPQKWLMQQQEKLWLLVDGDLLENIDTAIKDAYRYCHIYPLHEIFEPIEEQWITAPRLVAFDIEEEELSPLLTTFIEDWSQKGQAIVLVSSATVEQLQHQLGSLLIANLDNGRSWFRFWEPKKLRGLLCSLAKNQSAFTDFSGLVSSWLWFEPWPQEGEAAWYSHGPEKTKAYTKKELGWFDINNELKTSMDIFDEMYFKAELYEKYKTEFTDLRKGHSDNENFEWLYQHIKKLGMHSEYALSELFYLALTYGQESFAQKKVNRALHHETYNNEFDHINAVEQAILVEKEILNA